MDGNGGGGAEAERWLFIAEKLLAGRDLQGSRTFAIRARESDPRLDRSDRILAVIDTLLAGIARINDQHDWYAVLQLVRGTQDPRAISTQFARLAFLLSPVTNTLPFADLAFRLVSDAFSVLSNPNKKSIYDQELALFFESTYEPQPQPHIQLQPPPSVRAQQWLFTHQPQPHPHPQQQPQQDPQPQWQWQPHPQPQPPPPPPSPPQPRPFQLEPEPEPEPVPEPEPEPEPVTESEPMPPLRSSPKRGKISDNQDDESMPYSPESIEPDVPSFWTACPYCLNLYEYPKVYEECPMRCQNCRRAFHAAVLPPPPGIQAGKISHFCCWGFFPLGFSAPTSVKKAPVGKRVPRVYIDDDDDIFVDVSDPSEDSDDDDWTRGNRKRKRAKKVKGRVSARKSTKGRGGGQSTAGKVKGADGEISGAGSEMHGDVAEVKPETGKKATASNLRRHTGKAAKDLGKLDLNVEFSNEVEEPAAAISGNGVRNGEEEGVEGIGFFEGLDEFLSSLPILSVVGEEKVKAAE